MTKANEKAGAAQVNDAVKVEEVIKGTSKIADSAREFVKRSAATAKERSDYVYEGSEKFNSGLEKALNRVVSGYVGILGNVAEATHDNINHALTTAEKLAGAKSLSEAAQIQADYVRENTSANIERVRAAVNTTRDAVMEGGEAVRESVANVWPYGKKAA